MNKQLNRLGPIQQNLHGKACPFCGGTTYQLVLRASGIPTTRVYSFVAATAAIHEAWMRTSKVCCGSDFGTFGMVNENGGHSMPLRQPGTYRTRIRQIRKALHMLALSGVVRSSHVELRYATSFVNIEDLFEHIPGEACSSPTVKPPAKVLRADDLAHEGSSIIRAISTQQITGSDFERTYPGAPVLHLRIET